MRRFVAEALWGIIAKGSVRLSEIARALEETIPIKKSISRLSARLSEKGLARRLTQMIIADAAPRIKDDTLIIIDPSDIAKKYAKKMEYLARVRDGSEGKIVAGYSTIDVVAAEVGEAKIIPLYHELYSTKAPDFVSENDEILKSVETVSKNIGAKGIYVIDRGGDRGELFKPLLNEQKRFIIRLVGSRHLVSRGKNVLATDLAESCKTAYAERIVKVKNGKEKVYIIEFGFKKVKLPGRSEQLYLVVAKGFGAKPMMLLTNVKMRKNRKVLWWMVQAYLTRWRVEDTIRFIKQSYDLEDVRVLTYERLKNIAVLVLAAAYFTACELGLKSKRRILATHALKAAKRIFGIPDFQYYAIADGLKAILALFGKSINIKNAKKEQNLQMALLL